MSMIGVDVGGTFTDVVAIEDGQIKTVKVSTDVRNTHLAVLEGAREAGVENATVFNHASTHGLNAVITRRLPKIAFLTTLGHRDILDIGSSYRPLDALTDASWRRGFGDAMRPLVPRYLRRGIRERLKTDGSTLIPLDEAHAREELAVLRKCGVQGVSICLINAYVNPAHEQRLREIVHEELGADIPVSISSETSPLAKEWARASTTTIDVFMKLIYHDYTKKLGDGLREQGFTGDFNYANCAAQLLNADIAMEQPFEIVFAGPAAGTMASAHFGKLIDRGNLLCVDLGGTSCDISMVSGGDPYVNTTFLLEHDLIVNALSNEVESIGAGGGSLVTISPSGEVLVGPGSAGADPGPACYGKGGTQPATTDTLIMMGVIDPKTFAGGRMSLDPALSERAFHDLDAPQLSLHQRVNYAFNIGINNIAEGVTNIAIKHGIDPRDYSLVAFGAAGPMLLPACLDLVHARDVIVPPHPGLFSALGLVSSDQVYGDSRSSYVMLTHEAADSINTIYAQMEAKLRERFDDTAANVEFVRSMDARLAGQTWETPFVSVPSGEITAEKVDEMIETFHQVYESRAGNRFDGLPVQAVTYRVEAVIKVDKVDYPRLEKGDGAVLKPESTFELRYLTDEPVTAGRYQRETFKAGDRIEGPAVIHEALSTTFMLPGQVAEVGEYGELRITRA